MYVMNMAHIVQYHEHRTSFQKIVYTILNTETFNVLPEVPEKMNEKRNNSVLGLGV